MALTCLINVLSKVTNRNLLFSLSPSSLQKSTNATIVMDSLAKNLTFQIGSRGCDASRGSAKDWTRANRSITLLARLAKIIIELKTKSLFQLSVSTPSEDLNLILRSSITVLFNFSCSISLVKDSYSSAN